MTTPDISVIIPAWKAGSFIARAVDSALASQGVTLEVVVIDDASPDDTFAILQQIAAKDARVVIDRVAANGGPSAARNRAIELAKGRFIAVLDADDAVTPNRFARLLAIADSGAADIVVDNMLEVDDVGRALGDGTFLKSPEFAMPGDISLLKWIAFNQPMKAGDCLGYLKPLMRRDTLDRLSASYDPALRNSEDYYLVADLLAGGARMTYTPEPGYLYTRAAGSISHRLKVADTRAWLAAETKFQRQHRARLSSAELAALARRLRSLRKVDQFVAAVDALKGRKIGAFLGLLASDLSAAGFTLSTFVRIAAGKLLRRKLV